MEVTIFAAGTILKLTKSRFIPRQPFLYPFVSVCFGLRMQILPKFSTKTIFSVKNIGNTTSFNNCMKGEDKKHIKLIGTITITVIAGIATEKLKDLPIFDKIWKFILYAIDCVLFLFNLKVKFWLILLFASFAFIFFYLARKYKRRNPIKNKVDIVYPPHTSYTKDFIDNIKWEWKWVEYCDGWAITHLHALCPNDGAFLDDLSFHCPICNKYYHNINIEKVVSTIQLNVRKKYPNISLRYKSFLLY